MAAVCVRPLRRRYGLADVEIPITWPTARAADTLRFTKFWGVSWAHDGSGVYYDRYPFFRTVRVITRVVPAIYFHRLESRRTRTS